MNVTINVKECKNGEVWKVLQLIDRYSDSYNGIEVKEDEELNIDFNPKKTFWSTERTKAKFIKKLNKIVKVKES